MIYSDLFLYLRPWICSLSNCVDVFRARFKGGHLGLEPRLIKFPVNCSTWHSNACTFELSDKRTGNAMVVLQSESTKKSCYLIYTSFPSFYKACLTQHNLCLEAVNDLKLIISMPTDIVFWKHCLPKDNRQFCGTSSDRFSGTIQVLLGSDYPQLCNLKLTID